MTVKLKTGKSSAAHEMSRCHRTWDGVSAAKPAGDDDIAPSFTLQLIQNTNKQQTIKDQDNIRAINLLN
jgi:hypothetical protein